MTQTTGTWPALYSGYCGTKGKPKPKKKPKKSR